MAEAKKVTAANIKKLWYGETSEITADLTGPHRQVRSATPPPPSSVLGA